jgi:hypothetical protein
MPFPEIFDEVDGRLVPQVHIGLGPIAIAAGTSLSPALAISGLEIGNLRGRDLEVEVESGIITIQGLFRDKATSPCWSKTFTAYAPGSGRRICD